MFGSTVAVIIFVLAVLGERPPSINGSENPDMKKPRATSPKCSPISGDKTKIVCTCTETYCDRFDFDWPSVSGDACLIETSENGLRFRVTDLKCNLASNGSETDSYSVVKVDLSAEYQTIFGFGGAFTDAAAININSLSKPLGRELLVSYFGESGLQYTFGRVPIAGSDFSTRAYSYDDANHTDADLKYWSLAPEDIDHKIPVIQTAIELVQGAAGELKLIASPWSPPEWMKTSRSFKRGHLIDDDKIYKAYASYLIRFYKAYKSHGISFWGATIQNEPSASYLPFYFFNSLQMSAVETRKLVVDYLGPALEAEGYNRDNFKLMLGDDSLLFVDQQLPALDDAKFRKYVSGLAFHWYTSALIAPYSALSKLVNSVKDKVDFVIMSEACNGAMTIWKKHVDLGSWDRGEAYAIDIIEDMQRHVSAWIDWNLALDEQGGPNWSNNFVDSPIIVNRAKNVFYKQPMYYVLGHFSRFMRPNSIRVSSQLMRPNYFEKLMLLAAINKETGHLVVNILNKSTGGRKLTLLAGYLNGTEDQTYRVGPFQVQGRSISTVVIKL